MREAFLNLLTCPLDKSCEERVILITRLRPRWGRRPPATKYRFAALGLFCLIPAKRGFAASARLAVRFNAWSEDADRQWEKQ